MTGKEKDQGLNRQQEEEKLSEIIRIADDNLERTKSYISKLSDDLKDLLDVYETKDKEALALWHNTESQLNENVRDLDRCEKARKKPYFGWIRFQDPGMTEEESYYIGRVGIAKNGSDPVVIDWRAPVASTYYENAMGRCRYVVKNDGAYEIDLKRKRTYEIKDDRLVDFFDSDIVATDELLTKYLAKSKKAVLGEIIATIQKEQNEIIRRSPRTNLIVQGVAGSGKTTVAMHRISYILYNYEEFRPEDFYIIGSNRILLNYITSVLPELDVYGVSQMTMEHLFVRLLYEDWNPIQHKIRPLDPKDHLSCIKGSYDWFKDLEAFCREYERANIWHKEVRIEKTGALLMGPKMIEAYLENNPQLSMQSKINMLNEILLSKLENELLGKYVSYTPAEKKELQKKYAAYFGKDKWMGSIFELYDEFLQRQSLNGKPVTQVENTFDVYDLAALAYLYKRIKETDGIREASHIIIDEAQDFGMMAYGALNYCIRGCTYTIMGDTSQNIHYGYGLNDWEDLKKLILTGTFDSFGLLKKSYRNTVEISNFATEILRHGDFSIYPVEPIVRHGDPVMLAKCDSEEAMLAKSVETIEAWQKDGHETIAVICRDEAEAEQVSDLLGKFVVLADSNLETAEFGSGVIVLPVEFTKGLEFDAVLLYNPSEAHYPAENQYVKLLYVAATRALHQLAVIHLGDLTDLIGAPVSQEKRMKSLEQANGSKVEQYEKVEYTTRELQMQDIINGHKEMSQRGYLGPQKVVVNKAKSDDVDLRMISKIGETRKSTGGSYLDRGQSTASQTTTESTAISQSRARRSSVERTTAGQSPAGRSASGQFMAGGTTAGQSAARQGTSERAAASQSTSGQRAKIQKPVSAAAQKINPSPHKFGENIADSTILRPKGHGTINNAIRWVKKTKKHIDIASNYGILRLTPITEEIIRVQFQRGQAGDFAPSYWEKEPENDLKWIAKESKSMVQIEVGQLMIRSEKNNGALQFHTRSGQCLVTEKTTLPRQMEQGINTSQIWNYFDWQKKEKLSAKGILDDNLERLNLKARYISFGGKSMRMPLVVSDKGYGIGVAAESTVMCCDIPMYGPYIYAEDVKQIDYYFIYGENYGHIVELYKSIKNSGI